MSKTIINELEEQLACAADLMNTWARELGVKQCDNPYHDLALRELADRLWSKTSTVVMDLRMAAEGITEEDLHQDSEDDARRRVRPDE